MKNYTNTLVFILWIFLVVTSFFVWILLPDHRPLNLTVSVLTIIVSGLILYLNGIKIVTFMRTKFFKRFLSEATQILLLASILGMLLYFAKNFDSHLDLSKEKRFTLSNKTEELLKNIEGPLNIYVFAKLDQAPAFLGLLDLYRKNASDISLELVDPDYRPDLTSKYQVQQSGTVVFEYGDRFLQTQNLSEKDFSQTIYRLLKKRDPVICFTLGHGEPSLEENENFGLSRLKLLLQSYYLSLRPVDLGLLSSIESQCDILSIVSPMKEFSEKEMDHLNQFIQAGGNLILSLSPMGKMDEVSLLRLSLKDHGISFQNSIVVDLEHNVPQSRGTILLLKDVVSDHPILKGIGGPLTIPLVSSLIVERENHPQLDILLSSAPFPQSWANQISTDNKDINLLYQEGIDLPGPASLMAAKENALENGEIQRILALGSGRLWENQYLLLGGNRDLLLNSIFWLLGDEFYIANDNFEQEAPIFFSSLQLTLFFFIHLLLIPIIFFTCAGIAFYKKRQE